MTLKKKFRLTIAVVTAGLLTVAAFWIREQRITLVNDKQQSTRDLVAVPYSAIEQAYKLQTEGKISRAEAQRRAIQEIRTMRYSGNGYFWINDEHPTMVMHPMKPELDGTDLTGLHDPTGKAVFVVFRDAAMGKVEGDYVYYLWPKPGWTNRWRSCRM